MQLYDKRAIASISHTRTESMNCGESAVTKDNMSEEERRGEEEQHHNGDERKHTETEKNKKKIRS